MLEIGTSVDKGATRFGHFLAIHGEKAVHEHLTGERIAGPLQHRWPEEGMEIDDVLTDDVVNLRLGIVPVGVEIPPGVTTKFLSGGDVSYRGIEPDVEIFILL